MRSLYITQAITPRDEQSLNKYLNDVSRYDVLTADAEYALFQKYKNGDKGAYQLLIKSNLRFVISVAKQYGYSKLPLNDLINEGNIGLMIAAQKFDPSRGFKFISYAVWWIRQQILQAINQKSRKMRLPQNKKLLSNKIKSEQINLAQRLDRFPTTEELADHMDMNAKDVYKCLTYSKKCSSIDAFIDDDRQRSMHHVLADDSMNRPDHKLVILESMQIRIQELLQHLPQRESEIVARFYGVNGFQTSSLGEIASIMELSKERIRQIKDRSVSKLRRRIERSPVSTY